MELSNSTSVEDSGELNGTNITFICEEADKSIDDTFRWFLVSSVSVTVVLSFIVRRKNCFPSCCWNRPGFLQPLNFIDDIGRRWAYAACFVILTHEVVLSFYGEYHFELLPTDDMEWKRKYAWVSVFHKLFEALCICLVYYPLLACIDHRHSIAANVVGILYLIPWIARYTWYFTYCLIAKKFSDAVVFYLVRIPIYVALYVVGVCYVLDFVRNCMRIRKRRKAADKTKSASDKTEELGYKISHHLTYVFKLLQKRKPEKIIEPNCPLGAKSKKLLKQLKYEKILGFRYSTRIVCCITVSAAFLLWITIQSALKIEDWISVIINICERRDNPELETIINTICNDIIVVRILLHVANALAGAMVMGFLFNTLISYKRRWHQLLRGDHSWHMYGSTIAHPHITLLNGLKFAGYQAAYAVWGWVVLTFVLSVLFMFLAFALVIPLKNGEQNGLSEMLLKLCQTSLLSVFIALIQKVICRFCFLQDQGSVMALNNRRVYNAVSYYFLVLNVIVGFFSCLKRILILLVLGVTFLSRLDRPLSMTGLEIHDPGFASFVSMLLVDLHHNHPVVKTFVELMLKVKEQRVQQEQAKVEQQKTHLSGKDEEDAEQEIKKRIRSKMVKNRWLKTLTLVNNPSLAVKIIEQRLKDERKSAAHSNALLMKANVGSDVTDRQHLGADNETSSNIQVLVH